MIRDALLLFETAGGVAITVTRDSTNIIDLGVGRDMGVGDDPTVKLFISTQAAFTAAGAATLIIALSYSADNITYYVAAQSETIPVASLTANKRVWDIGLPVRPVEMSTVALMVRYMKLVYTVATGPMTAGAIEAGLVLDTPENYAYPPGIVIAN